MSGILLGSLSTVHLDHFLLGGPSGLEGVPSRIAQRAEQLDAGYAMAEIMGQRVAQAYAASCRLASMSDGSPSASAPTLTAEAKARAIAQVEEASEAICAFGLRGARDITREMLEAMDRQLYLAMKGAETLWAGECVREALEAFDAVGGMALILQRWDEAIIAYRRADNHSAFVGCHFERGMQKFKEGKWSEAKVDFKTVAMMCKGKREFADMYRRAVGWRNVCQFREDKASAASLGE